MNKLSVEINEKLYTISRILKIAETLNILYSYVILWKVLKPCLVLLNCVYDFYKKLLTLVKIFLIKASSCQNSKENYLILQNNRNL